MVVVVCLKFLLSSDLSYNTIPVITSHFDKGLAKLQWLSLEGNILNEIYPDTLGNITELKHLSLARNSLRKIVKGTFRPKMVKLEFMDLSMNKISNLYANEISEMTSLKELNLMNNKLSTIETILIDRIKGGLVLHFEGKQIILTGNCIRKFIRLFVN